MPLTRRTPLQPGKPLTRTPFRPVVRSALNSTPPLRTGRRAAPKRTRDPEWANDKVVVLVRDGYRCRKCGKPTRTVHHRRLKGMGGAMNDPTRNRPDRCVALCTLCHDWVHGDHNRKAAEAMGLIVPRTQATETTPCLTVDGRLLFTVDGQALAA